MTITRLDLKSFKAYADVTFDLRAPRTLIAGLNGAGKTSVREAIRYVLLGSCQGLDGKGAGIEHVVPTFAQGGGVSVSAWIEGIGSVTRTWLHGTSSLEVQGFTGTTTEQQAALLEKLGVSEGMLRACLDSTTFLSLHHADAKALVLSLLNVTITVRTGDTETVYTLDQLDAAYARAFEERKAAKQRVKGAFVPPAPTVPTTSTDLDSIDRRLAELRRELQTATASIADTDARKAMLDREYAKAVLREVEPEVPADLDAQIDGLEERLALMEADTTVYVPTVAAGVHSGMDISAVRQRADRLIAFNPKDGCVLDNGLPCPVAKLKFTNRGKDLLETVPSDAPVPSPPPVNPLTAVRKELDGLKAQKAVWVRATEHNLRQTAEQDRIRAEMTALPDVSATQRQIATCQEAIRKGDGIQKTAQTYHAALRAHQEAAAHKATLEAEVERLEALVDVLGPSGARVQALADALGRFEQGVNASLASFGWTVAFQVDPWRVVVNGRPVETYSRSEQHRIGIALQVAIADLSGLGVVVVDELDMLDGGNRDTMGQILLRSPIPQVIILGTRDATVTLPTKLPSYRVATQDGRSLITERSGL